MFCTDMYILGISIEERENETHSLEVATDIALHDRDNHGNSTRDFIKGYT